MPDKDVPLHRVSGLARGVNWRVTKFAAAVPHHLSCGLCHVISQATFLLPCLHTLCESCASPSVDDGSIMCPFDEESFTSGDCRMVDLPQATADRLKACCWNEAHGCNFVGPLQAVLTHYEQECTFHAVTCTRCNGHVLRQDLPRHYRAGCHGEAIASVAAEPRLPQGVAVSAEDIGTRIDAIARILRDSERRLSDQLAQAKQELSTTFAQKLESQQRELSAKLATLSELERSNPGANEMQWRLEKRHILRKLELIATDSLAYLESLRTSADQQLKRPAVAYIPFLTGLLRDTAFMPPLTGKRERGEECYSVNIRNIEDLANSRTFIVLFAVWYRRDRYLQVAASGYGLCLRVFLKWGTTEQGSSSAFPEANVYVRHPCCETQNFLMDKCDYPEELGDLLGFHERFEAGWMIIKTKRLVRDGKLTLVVSFKI